MSDANKYNNTIMLHLCSCSVFNYTQQKPQQQQNGPPSIIFGFLPKLLTFNHFQFIFLNGMHRQGIVTFIQNNNNNNEHSIPNTPTESVISE